MAATVYNQLGSDQELRLNLECKLFDNTHKIVHNEKEEIKVLVSEKCALDLEFDINEIQELQIMSTRPLVRKVLESVAEQIGTVLNNLYSERSIKKKTERSWVDVVVGRNPLTPILGPSTPQRIATVITSRSSQQRTGNPVMGSSKFIHTEPIRTVINRKEDKRSDIIIIGDSHARGCAGDLLHHVKQQYKVTGYIKPNAGLLELLHTAKSNTSKLTKRDTIIIIGGTNDIEKNRQRKNLTSIGEFIEETQHTNIIFVDVPLRYDLGVRPQINEEIMKYNRKVNKLTQRQGNVKTVKVITNRELFTLHGLHLNRKGKEVLLKGIMEKIQSNTNICKPKPIGLPWKNELAATTTLIMDVTTEETKILEETNILDRQPINSQESGTNATKDVKEPVTSRRSSKSQRRRSSSKSQRNCPKVKNGDYLWN